jgi:uroporphyrinogen-III synthase
MLRNKSNGEFTCVSNKHCENIDCMSKRVLYLGLDPTHYQSNGQVTHWPIIQIVPRPLSDPSICKAFSHFAHYSHVIVTSKSTVAILQNYLPLHGISLQTWAKKATLAVGQITANHLKAYGITPIRVAQEETAEGIIFELKQISLEQAYVFWPHSSQARSTIKEFLLAQNIHHTTCILYDPKPQIPRELPPLETFEEIVFTSPSTVKAFLQIFGQFPSHARLVSIGPITSRFLEEQKKNVYESMDL